MTMSEYDTQHEADNLRHQLERQIAIPRPDDKLADDRAVVTLHATECRQCEWQTGFSETDEDRAADADRMTAHSRTTGHRLFWSYTAQRGQSRLMFL